MSQESQYNKWLAKIRQKHPRAYESWTTPEENRLKRLYNEGLSIAEISVKLQRQTGGIRARLVKLGLVDNKPTPAPSQPARKLLINISPRPAPARPQLISPPQPQPEPSDVARPPITKGYATNPTRPTLPTVPPRITQTNLHDEDEEDKYFTCPKCKQEKRRESSRFIGNALVCLACSGSQATPNHRYRTER